MKGHIGPYRRNRKISVKIHEYDCWGLATTLAMVIHPALVEFQKQEKNGCSPIFMGAPDLNEHDHSDKAIKIGQEKFKEILDKMIWSFNQLSLDEEFDESPRCPSPIRVDPDVKQANGCIRMGDRYYQDGALEKWRKEIKAYDDRIQEGIDLFAKYYQYLWD